MVYGIVKSKDVLLSMISEALKESTQKKNTIERLSINSEKDSDPSIEPGKRISLGFLIRNLKSGNSSEIYIDNKLLATVEMSEAGIYEEDKELQLRHIIMKELRWEPIWQYR